MPTSPLSYLKGDGSVHLHLVVVVLLLPLTGSRVLIGQEVLKCHPHAYSGQSRILIPAKGLSVMDLDRDKAYVVNGVAVVLAADQAGHVALVLPVHGMAFGAWRRGGTELHHIRGVPPTLDTARASTHRGVKHKPGRGEAR